MCLFFEGVLWNNNILNSAEERVATNEKHWKPIYLIEF